MVTRMEAETSDIFDLARAALGAPVGATHAQLRKAYDKYPLLITRIRTAVPSVVKPNVIMRFILATITI